jgi:hypothetical protein
MSVGRAILAENSFVRLLIGKHCTTFRLISSMSLEMPLIRFKLTINLLQSDFRYAKLINPKVSTFLGIVSNLTCENEKAFDLHERNHESDSVRLLETFPKSQTG